jgi:uncharacterized protein
MSRNLGPRWTWCALGLFLSVVCLDAAGRSDVADAVMRGDQAALRSLLSQKADVNAPQADNATALHWAVYRNDVNAAALLIEAGANVNTPNREGITPLILACMNGSAPLVEALLKAGASSNERMQNGETALMMASRTGNVAAMKVLLDHGADVKASEDLRGTTALMWAAAEGHPDAISLLIDHGADVSTQSSPDSRGKTPGSYGKSEDPRPSRLVERNPNQLPRPPNFADRSGGGLTALAFATRRNDLESIRVLLARGADVNQTTHYGWTPLLIATQNRYYQLGSFLLDHGADPNIANNGGWTPLYLAVDNRNIEGGDYPVRKGDMNHLDFIQKLLDRDPDVNARVMENTEHRTVFRGLWVNEVGATAFWRAAQSSDLVVMRMLLARGADPKIATKNNVTALQVAAGIGWVDGITYEWSEAANVETVRLLLDLGVDPNIQAETGRTALHGAAHKGRNTVVQMLVDHGARLDTRDYGMTGSDAGGFLMDHTWQPVDYADGLVRIGVQSAVAQPQTGLLLRKLMTERGLPVPPMDRTLESVCMAPEFCDDVKYEDLK